MKYLYLLLLTLPLLAHTYPAEAEDKTISLDDVTVDSDLAASDKDSQLQKRSGSGDYALHLKQGFLASLGQASASLASSSSGGSSGGGYGGGYKSYGGDGHHGNSVDYDPWSFKKTVLNTIFQAVKAITGGVTALKGQLIKGSGYALSASGQLVAASGDKVTDVGKYIINSATSKLHPIPSGGGGQHPFSKFASLSGASSGGSSGGGGGHGKPHSGPVVHTESITSYEIPSGHSSYGPPSKPPSYSSATHQYLPPSGSGGYTGGGAGFSGGHVAFEAPSSNYLPTAYGPDASNGQEFNIYGRHQKLSDEEAKKAAVQLQEILSMLPNGKTEYTASKTVSLDTSNAANNYNSYGENVDLQTYGLPNDLGPLESLSHTEQITAAYGPKNQYDLYHQMQKQKQSPEEVYIQKHPNEGYDYKPPYNGGNSNNNYKYDNYHAAMGGNKNALNDLTPILAALEVAKNKQPSQAQVSYAVEKNVHKVHPNNGPAQYLPPAVQKTKYIYYPPTPSKYEYHTQYNNNKPPPYNGPYKVKRHAADVGTVNPKLTRSTLFKPQDFDNYETIMYNPILSTF